MKLTEKQSTVLAARGHLLVMGGPGSGKTTISILKAAKIVEFELRPEQKVLFLSFARATVSRVVEAIEYEQKIPHEQKRGINVETYHSFFWRLLKTHGYLVGLPRQLSILTPPDEAIALSAIRNKYTANSKLNNSLKIEKKEQEDAERMRLARNEGRVCFNLFAHLVGEIALQSNRIRKLISTRYPVIILDEFQDTNLEQWRVVQAFGQNSTLVALADPEQRIYDFIGADPERLDHFKETFSPTIVDLGAKNHRSSGLDIAAFGNDVLRGIFKKENYNGVNICRYEAYENQAKTSLVTTVYAARRRLINIGCMDWSLAILVPTKKMTGIVSDALRLPPANMTPISHTPAIELDAAILAAEVIAFLMQPDADGHHFEQFIGLICNYFQGRGGDTPTNKDLQEAEKIRKAYDKYLVRKKISKSSILTSIKAVYEKIQGLRFGGNPDKDWKVVRSVLEVGVCARLKKVAEDSRNIRLLERGTQIRQELSEDWREKGAYINALAISRKAFVREHFSTKAKPERGIVVMNMHKAKGKQFDEVIIFEGWPRINKGQIIANLDRIVRYNTHNEINTHVRQLLRVSITRGKQGVTILTPKSDPCVLLC